MSYPTYGDIVTLVRARTPTRWLLFLLVVVPLLLLLLWYIHRTFVNTIYLDGFMYVPLIGRFLEGNWSLGDLFVRFGEHMVVGYGLLSLLNAKFLALNMQLDPVMFLAASSVIAAIVYAECSRVFSTVRLYVLGILFVPLGFLCFSLVAPPGMMMSTQFMWGSTVALLIAWFVQRDFYTSGMGSPRRHWSLIMVLILVPLYFLLLSGAYFPGLVLGLGATYIFRALLTGKWRERRIVLVVAVGLMCVLCYGYYVFVAQAIQEEATSSGILHYFSDPVGTVKSYLAGIGGGLMDGHTLEYTGVPVIILGGVMAAIGVVALWLFVRTRMYAKTYLPVYCMFYSLGIMTSVYIGRGLTSGWGAITAEWYSFHLRFFVIGVVWILLYALVQRLRYIRAGKARLVNWRSWPVALALVALALVFACHAIANVAQWQRGPSVHAWLAEKRNALLFPQFYENASDVLLWPEEAVVKCRAILVQHELSCFSPRGWADVVGDSHNGILRVSGWYADDWIGRKGYAVFTAQAEGELSFNGYVPEFIPSNHVEVYINDEAVFAADLAGGDRAAFSGRVQAGSNIIAVTCERAASPLSRGVGLDSRPLALHLTLRFKQAS